MASKIVNKKKVLIVEDEELVLKMYSIKFKKHGFEVLEAKDGKEGLKKALKENPDIMLLDIILPVINGYNVLKKLKNKKNIPVLILTNIIDTPENIKKGMNLGAEDYLFKFKYTPQDVLEKVTKILSKVK